MSTLLEMKDVWLSYHTKEGETEALAGVTLTVDEGEFVALVGPSGCGKTTVLSVIAGLLSPTAGSVRLCGRDVTGPTDSVGYMLQRDTLFEWLTIRANVLLGLRIQKKLTPERTAYADALLEKYGLGDFADRYPAQLSGGMRQRAALIRTLAFKPRLLLLDEPFSALDAQTRVTVGDDVCGIIREEGGTALMVTHDIAEAAALAGRVVVLSPRPAHVVGQVVPDLPEGGAARRSDRRFTSVNGEIRKLLARHG